MGETLICNTMCLGYSCREMLPLALHFWLQMNPCLCLVQLRSVIYYFSKRLLIHKLCSFWEQMSKMDLNEEDEKVNIETIFWSAMDMLSDDDKKLPQASCFNTTAYLYY